MAAWEGAPKESTQPHGAEWGRLVEGEGSTGGGGVGILPRRGDSSFGGEGSQVSKVDCNSSNRKPGTGLVPETFILLVWVSGSH